MRSATHPSKSSAWLGWLQDFKKEQRYIGRYSVEKLYAFHEYQEKTSIYRVMAVVVLTPLPTVLVLWGLDCIPLPDPRGGAQENTTTFLRSILSHTIMTFMVLNCGKQALGLNAPGTKYTHKKAILISICAAVVLEAWWLIWAFAWRFPTPCRELFTFIPWMSLTVLFNYVFAKADFRGVWDRLQRYIPVVGTQVVLYYFLLFLSVGFIAVPWWAQITMIFLFPVVKLLIKRALWKYARNLHDLSADVTICMVEISGSLYQTVCMNYVESKSMVILLLILDFVQVAHEAHLYIRHDYVMDSKSTLQTAMNIVEDARSSDAIAEKLTADLSLVALPFDENTDEQHTPGAPLGTSRSKNSAKIQPLTYAGHEEPDRREASPVGPIIRGYSLTAKIALFKKVFSRAVQPVRLLPETKSSTKPSRKNKGQDSDDERLFRHRGVEMRGASGISIDGVLVPRREQARILEQTLQLLFGAEVLLFVEYVEMFVPVLYSALIGGLWNLPNAKYNVILMNMSYDAMVREVATSLGYGLLEVVSFVLVYFFLKKRYGISALYQLAFLLESYTLTLQGKLVGSYIVILNSTTIHHGTDVTFKFDWDALLQTSNPLSR